MIWVLVADKQVQGLMVGGEAVTIRGLSLTLRKGSSAPERSHLKRLRNLLFLVFIKSRMCHL